VNVRRMGAWFVPWVSDDEKNLLAGAASGAKRKGRHQEFGDFLRVQVLAPGLSNHQIDERIERGGWDGRREDVFAKFHVDFFSA